MGYKWKPLQRATVDRESYLNPKYQHIVEMQMERDKCTFGEAVATLEAYDKACSYWRNDLYQVQMRVFHNEGMNCEMAHLNIRRIDGAAIFDWRHRQLIKNQLVGAECEAVELYPAESRLVDTSNKYHLWCLTTPGVRFAFGMTERDVIDDCGDKAAGQRQRRI